MKSWAVCKSPALPTVIINYERATDEDYRLFNVWWMLGSGCHGDKNITQEFPEAKVYQLNNNQIEKIKVCSLIRSINVITFMDLIRL